MNNFFSPVAGAAGNQNIWEVMQYFNLCVIKTKHYLFIFLVFLYVL